MTKNYIGSILKKYRTNLLLTQNQLADEINQALKEEDNKNSCLNQSYINKIEKGNPITDYRVNNYLVNKFMLFDVEQSFEGIQLADFMLNTLDESTMLDLEKIFNFTTTDELFEYLIDVDINDNNNNIKYLEKKNRISLISNQLQNFPRNPYINISCVDEQKFKIKYELNSTALIILYFAYNYIFKIKKIISDKFHISKSDADEAIEIINLLSNNSINWEKEPSSAVLGKYINSMNRKIDFYIRVEEEFPTYIKTINNIRNIPNIKGSPNINDKINILKKIDGTNWENLEEDKLSSFLETININDTLSTMVNIYNYYQNNEEIGIPTSSFFEIVTDFFIENEWFKEIPFINEKGLESYILNIKQDLERILQDNDGNFTEDTYVEYIRLYRSFINTYKNFKNLSHI